MMYFVSEQQQCSSKKFSTWVSWGTTAVALGESHFLPNKVSLSLSVCRHTATFLLWLDLDRVEPVTLSHNVFEPQDAERLTHWNR